MGVVLGVVKILAMKELPPPPSLRSAPVSSLLAEASINYKLISAG